MNRLIVVSNRLPVSIKRKGGSLIFEQSVGGLATGLGSFYKSYESVWVGWPGIPHESIKDKIRDIEHRLLEDNCYPVYLTQNEIDKYYFGFTNKTIWPLFHYFTQYAEYNEQLWNAYKQVNRSFANELMKIVRPGDIVWIHDYHLMLLPKLIKDRVQKITTVFFLHIPFPSFEVFRLLPWRKDIIRGLLGSDIIGFHTYDYVKHFMETASRLLGVEYSFNQISIGNRVVKVDAFPMGIDYDKFNKSSQRKDVAEEINKMKEKLKDTKVILSIDRLDYTKGIPARLEAYDMFLSKNPEYKGKVVLFLVVVPSRTKVEYYKILKKKLEELVGKINGKHSTIDWIPVQYLYRSLPFNILSAFYNISDVALITPMRDGMNLIAKEYIASKVDGKGVLILSEMAGAATEMGEAIIVNPNNTKEVADSIKKAIEMSENEQIARNRIMQNRLKRYDVVRWASDFMDSIDDIKKLQKEMRAKIINDKISKMLADDYKSAKNRLLFLDYDGTLVPFASKPEKAFPDEEILSILKDLCKNKHNEVVIISGRDRETLNKWFSGFDINLIAEHGVWLKDKKGEWEMIEPLISDWKEEIMPILEFFHDRTPGSFIEEKGFSLVWHYRNANPELGIVRARELKDALRHFTSNLNLEILEGKKVIEVKNAGINKGKAVLKWLSGSEWDFVLAIGDDWTDEDIFAVLPDSAYSIKVGLESSKARFNLDSVNEVRNLLNRLRRL